MALVGEYVFTTLLTTTLAVNNRSTHNSKKTQKRPDLAAALSLRRRPHRLVDHEDDELIGHVVQAQRHGSSENALAGLGLARSKQVISRG